MTTIGPETHYSPAAAGRALAGDIRGTLACGAEYWSQVTDSPALVSCGPCKAAAPAVARLAAARAARAKTSVNNPLNLHLDGLIAAVEAALDLAIAWQVAARDLGTHAERAGSEEVPAVLRTRAEAGDDHATALRKALA